MDSVFRVPDDELLLKKARKGDLDALETLYRAYEQPLFTLARRFCPKPQDAEELVQETFLEVIRSLKGFRGDSPFWVWVRKVAASKALMRIRDHGRHREESLTDDEDAGRPLPRSLWQHPSAETDAERAALEKALSALSPTSRSVVWLHDVEGYTHDEIAELMGKTASFSKSQLARAHERLRALLSPTVEALPCTQPSSSS
jgi:RNA polymerase sigma-70 factor (ECF subfamily)